MKTALILGVNGQDGSYLAELLLEKGYRVHGLARHSSVDNLGRIRHFLLDDALARREPAPPWAARFTIHQGDITDPVCLERLIRMLHPDEIYNEADQDSVGWSSVAPAYQFNVTATAVVNLLEIVRNIRPAPPIKVFQPVTAHMFGDPALLPAGMQCPQNERTPFNPQSPYAIAKTAVFYACRHYREQHGLFVSTALFFSHDSPRRSEHYLLHKICAAAVRIAKGQQTTLPLGNLDARVDVGYAPDYMEAAHAMLQLDRPDDFVLGTGEAWTVKDMVLAAFRAANVCPDPERGVTDFVTVDPAFFKPSPRAYLCADYAKAKAAFGYEPKTSMHELVRLLVEHFKEHV